MAEEELFSSSCHFLVGCKSMKKAIGFWVFLLCFYALWGAQASPQKTLNYSVRYNSEILLSFSDLVQDVNSKADSALGKQKYHIIIEGMLNFSLINSTDEISLFEGTFEPKIVKFASEEEDDSEAITKALQKARFWVELTSDGQWGRFWYSPTAPISVYNLLKGLISVYAQQIEPSEHKWTAVIPSAEGNYEWQYRMLRRHAERWSMERVPLRLMPSNQVFALNTTPQVKGKLLIEWDPQRSHLVSLKGELETIYRSGESTLTRSRTRVEWRLIRTMPMNAQAQRRSLREWQTISQTQTGWSIDEVLPDPEYERRALQELLGKDDFQSLWKATQAIKEFGQTGSADLSQKWYALLSLRPKTIDQVEQQLRKTSWSNASAQIVIGALCRLNSLEAQSALLRLIRANQAWLTQNLDLFQSLLMSIEHPSVELVKSIWEMTRQAKGDALKMLSLNLGTLVKRLPPAPKELQNKIIKWMISQHDQADREDKVHWILALGNTGSPSVLKTIMFYSLSDNPQIRWAVASALTPISDPKAEETLLQYATTDPDKNVRLNAIDGLEYRNWSEEVYKRLASALDTEQEAEVRRAIVQVLWNKRNAFPEVRDILQRVARSDKSGEVRQLARDLLSQSQ